MLQHCFCQIFKFNAPFDVSDYLTSGFYSSCPIKNSGDSSFFEQGPACTVKRMVVLFLEVLTANSCPGYYLYIQYLAK